MKEPLMAIGKIVAPQGLRGEVRVYPESDFPERFLEPGTRWLQKPGQPPVEMELVAGRYLDGKGLFVVQFARVDDREAAEAIIGSKILVRESDRPQLEEDEFHVRDLIGLTVVEQTSQAIVGTVVDVFPAGNDLLEVQRPGKDDRVLIPFVMAIVPVVDLAQGRIEITPPKGLLD
jgi:16S rRNA processing protein RimM